MVWLICAIVSSSMISITFKVSEKHSDNGIGIIVVNYVICCLTAALYMAAPVIKAAGGTAGDAGQTGIATLTELVSEPSFGVAMALATAGGVIYVAGFLAQQWNIRVNGIVLTSVFVKMGLLVTMALSVVVFRERPGAVQIAGFIVAVAAILVINMEKGSTRAASITGLLILLACGGLSDGISKFYEYYCDTSLNGIILLVQFAVALVLAIVYLRYRGQSIGKPELLFGALVGVPNYFCSLFLLKALETVPAVVVFPTFNIGAFLIISATGLVVFKERLSGKQLAGCGMIVAAILMLNL